MIKRVMLLEQMNRKHMPSEMKQKIAKGATVARFSHGLMALRWFDKKEVTMLSTFHDETITDVKKTNRIKRKSHVLLSIITTLWEQ